MRVHTLFLKSTKNNGREWARVAEGKRGGGGKGGEGEGGREDL